MRNIVSIFFAILVHLNLYSQEKKTREYILFDKYIEADFKNITYDSIYNNSKIHCKGLSLIDNVFDAVEGEYTVYRFLSHNKGTFMFGFNENMPFDFWYIIILKTDRKNRIIDGYWYFLTDPEQPNCTLYRLTSQKIKLTHNLNIEKLKFKREQLVFNGEDMCNEIPAFLGEYLGENGRLVYRVKNVAKTK